MTHHSLLAMTLLVGVPVMLVWRALIRFVAILAVVAFCLGVYGLYHVALYLHL